MLNVNSARRYGCIADADHRRGARGALAVTMKIVRSAILTADLLDLRAARAAPKNHLDPHASLVIVPTTAPS